MSLAYFVFVGTGQPGPSEEAAGSGTFDARGSDRSQDRTREGAIPKRRAIVERSTSKSPIRSPLKSCHF